MNGYYKAELIRGPAREGRPWKSIDDVELATLGWVHWHNHDRLHGYLDDVPPAEFEEAFYATNRTDQIPVEIQYPESPSDPVRFIEPPGPAGRATVPLVVPPAGADAAPSGCDVGSETTVPLKRPPVTRSNRAEFSHRRVFIGFAAMQIGATADAEAPPWSDPQPVPFPRAGGNMHKILIGYDGSEAARRALTRATEVFQIDAEIAIISVAPYLYAPHGASPYDPADSPEEHEDQAAEARGLPADRGSEARVIVAHGDPVTSICERGRTRRIRHHHRREPRVAWYEKGAPRIGLEPRRQSRLLRRAGRQVSRVRVGG